MKIDTSLILINTRSLVESEDRKLILRFSIFGALFGLCFPLIGISFDLIYRDFDFHLASIIRLHQLNPIHFIIDSAPLILSLTAFGISKYVQKREKNSRAFLQHELQKNQQLAQLTRCILEGKSHMSLDNNLLDKETLHSLETIQNRLLEQQESDIRNQWAVEGQASVMQILKKMEDDWQQQLLSLLCRLTATRQGVFWQLSDDEAWMEIRACFAPDELFATEMRIAQGQGLSGQVWQSGCTQQLEKLPGHYLKVSSGLGASQEACLLIVPLCLDEKVYGILEFASFTRIPDYRVQWLEEMGEQIALKIVTLRHENELSSLLQSTQDRISLLEQENARLQQG